MFETVLLVHPHHFLRHDGLKVLVKNLLLQVSQGLETLECLVQSCVIKFKTQFREALLKA